MADQKLNTLAVNIEARTRNLEKALERVEKQTRGSMGKVERDAKRHLGGLEAAMGRATVQAGSLARTFATAFAGGMFAGGIAGFARSVRSVVSEMSKLGNVSEMVGIAAEDLQRLRYGFETTGVAADQTDTALRRFARRIGEAANGGGQLYEVLKANNVQLRNADGSMRSQIELLRDYANLIKNAGSHQERLSLAFKAFDVAGASMVQALSNGADGLNTLMDKAEEAGGVIDEELIKKAQELDTRWAATWRSFEINAKSAVMNVVSILDDLHGKFSDLGNHDFFKWLVGKMDSAGLIDRSMLIDGGIDTSDIAAIERRVGLLRDQVENLRDLGFDATEAERELAIAMAELEAAVAAAMSGGGRTSTTLPTITVDGESAPTTIIPGGSDSGSGRARSRNAAADAALREMQAVNDLIDSLNFELSLIGKSDMEKAKANALRRAGAAASDDQKQAIESLIEAIHNETEALRQNEEAQRNRERALKSLFDMGGDALMQIVSGSEKAEDALKKLIIQLALAAAQAALLNTGPLAGLFGGGGGNFHGTLFTLEI